MYVYTGIWWTADGNCATETQSSVSLSGNQHKLYIHAMSQISNVLSDPPKMTHFPKKMRRPKKLIRTRHFFSPGFSAGQF